MGNFLNKIWILNARGRGGTTLFSALICASQLMDLGCSSKISSNKLLPRAKLEASSIILPAKTDPDSEKEDENVSAPAPIAADEELPTEQIGTEKPTGLKIANLPVIIDSAGTPFLNIQVDQLVEGQYVAYKYKIEEISRLDCNENIIQPYSPEIDIHAPIQDSTESLSVGTIGICVIGKKSDGQFQPFSEATTAQFTKVASTQTGFSLARLANLDLTGTYGTRLESSSPGPRAKTSSGLLYFMRGTNNPYSFEPEPSLFYKTDGTTAGTGAIMQICTDSSQQFVKFFTRTDGTKAFFKANGDEPGCASGTVGPPSLWVSDGTIGGTHHIFDPGTESVSNAKDYQLYIFNSFVYILANSGKILKINPVTNAVVVLTIPNIVSNSLFGFLNEINGKLLFSVKTSLYGFELWTLDSSDVLTPLDIYAGVTDGLEDPAFPATVIPNALFQGWIYFIAKTAATGSELFRTDGTSTQLVKDKTVGAGSTFASPKQIIPYMNILVITKTWGTVYESDGIVGGVMNAIEVSVEGIQFGEYNSKLYSRFYKSAQITDQLWVSTGTVGNFTKLRSDLVHQNLAPFLVHPIAGVFFTISTAQYGAELFVLNSANEGTFGAMLKDINPGAADGIKLTGGSSMTVMSQNASYVFFTASVDPVGTELYVSDGSPSNTHVLKDIWPGDYNSSTPEIIDVVGDHLLFFATDQLHGRELWASDGTEVGTTLLKDVNISPLEPELIEAKVAGSELFFVYDDNSTGKELWKTDGTVAGTRNQFQSKPGNDFYSI